MHSSTQRLTWGLTAIAALICLALGLAAHPAHAQAGYYTYTLNDVSFNQEGSGTASGYFDYDPTTEQFGSYDIVTTEGTNHRGQPLEGSSYVNGDGGSAYAYYLPSRPSLVFTDGQGEDLGFDLYSYLTNGGTQDVAFDFEGRGSVSSSHFNVLAQRNGTGGTLVGAPEAAPSVPELSPLATIALMSVLGCGALGVAGVKRRRTAGTAI